MRICAIDPGTEKSAFVWMNNDGPCTERGILPNDDLLPLLREYDTAGAVLAIEQVQSYGMPVGAEIFTSVLWAGRFIEAWGGDFLLVPRRAVKLHLCGSARAKDGNVRQAILDRFGGRKKALGCKAQPGPLYGFKADLWAALGVALTVYDGGAALCVGRLKSRTLFKETNDAPHAKKSISIPVL